MATRTLQVTIAGDESSLSRAFRKGEQDAKRFGDRVDKEGRRVHGFATITSKGFSRVGVAAGGMATAGVGAAALLAKSFVSGASDINESLTKNQVLFGRYAKDVDAFSRDSAASFGISRKAALEYAGVFGNLFTALGVSGKKSSEFSVNLTKLAADMASFNNTSIDDALEAIRSGLVGETEPLRKFGVNLNDATLRQQALSMGLTHSTKNVLTPYQKAMASQALIVKQTSSAHGDFARTSGGLANQQRILQARLSDSTASLGAKLMPAALAAVKALNSLFNSSSSGGRVIASMGRAAQAAAGWIKNAWAGAVAAVHGFIDRNREDINSLGHAMRNLGIAIKAVIEHVIIPAVKILAPFVKTALEGVLETIRGVIRVVSGVLTGQWGKAWDGIKDIVRGRIKSTVAIVEGSGKLLLAGAKAAGKAIATGILAGLGQLGHLLLEKVKDAVGWVKSQVGGIASGIGKALNPFGDGVGQPSLPPIGSFGGGLDGARPSMAPFAAAGARFGLHVSSGLRRGAITSSGNQSYHSSGEAIDEAGSPAGMLGFFRQMKSRYGSRLAELIYTPGGQGIKDGRPYTYSGQVARDHYDHVHVAYDTGAPGVGDGIGQAVSAARSAGFRGTDLVNAVAIAGAESKYDAEAKNFKYPDHSIGFWQINQLAHHGRFGTDKQLEDPVTNARAAYALFRESGFRPWSTWPKAAAAWTGRARVAVQSGGSSGSSGGSKAKGKPKSGSSTGGGSGKYDPVSIYGGDVPADADERQRRANQVAGGSGPLKGVGSRKGRSIEEADALQAASDQGDPNQPLIDAINAAADIQKKLDEDIKAVKASIDAQTEFARGVEATSNFQLTKNLADLISGHIVGRGVAGRAFTPGTGVEIAYMYSAI